MIAIEVIQKAQSCGVLLTLSNDKQNIQYRGERTVIQQLLPILKEYKTEITEELLTQTQHARVLPVSLQEKPPIGNTLSTAYWSPPMVVALTLQEEELIRAWFNFRGLTDVVLIDQIVERCGQNSDNRVCFLELTKEDAFMAAPPISLLTGELIPFFRPLIPMTPKQEKALRFFFHKVKGLDSEKANKIVAQCQKDFRTRQYYLKHAITKTRQWEDEQSKKWGGHEVFITPARCSIAEELKDLARQPVEFRPIFKRQTYKEKSS